LTADARINCTTHKLHTTLVAMAEIKRINHRNVLKMADRLNVLLSLKVLIFNPTSAFAALAGYY
jgi:hypothetical protein